MNDNDFGFKLGDLNAIVGAISKFPDITKAVIFGSRAKGTYKPGSDVDIVVWSASDESTRQLSGILNDETLLPYKFDVVNYDQTDNQNLRAQIMATAVNIYPEK